MDKYNIPIEFEQVMNVMDDRFIRVKIYIAHTGENRNRSIFSKEILQSMIPSLANVPILGYLAVDENGNQDFKGHEEKLVVENKEFKFKYLGRAWGLIPEQNNAHFEFRYGEDGVEREYLVTEGVLWRKFPEVEEIFDRDGGFKSQSMELFPPSVDGYVNNEGLFVFTKAKFEGATILGEGVTPAMVSSTIEKFSVANDIKADLSEMLTEFNARFAQTQQKGDDIVENENLEPTNQEPTPVEPVVEPVVEPEATEPVTDPVAVEPTPEPEVEPQPETEPQEPVQEPDPEVTPEPEVTEPQPEPTPEKFTLKFELSHEDIRSKIYRMLDDHIAKSGADSDVEDPNYPDWYYIVAVFDDYLIAEDDEGDDFFKVQYSVDANDNVVLGQVEEVFPMFVNQAEKSAIDMHRSNFTALEQEVVTLREFKAGIELAEKEEKLTSYSTVLSDEEMTSIKENISKFSLVELEKEIGFMLLKKNHFSANDQAERQHSRVGAVPQETPFQYGTLSKYFTKN